MSLFGYLHDGAIQGNPSDSAAFENLCCQIGRVHFIHFSRLKVKS